MSKQSLYQIHVQIFYDNSSAPLKSFKESRKTTQTVVPVSGTVPSERLRHKSVSCERISRITVAQNRISRYLALHEHFVFRYQLQATAPNNCSPILKHSYGLGARQRFPRWLSATINFNPSFDTPDPDKRKEMNVFDVLQGSACTLSRSTALFAIDGSLLSEITRSWIFVSFSAILTGLVEQVTRDL